MTPDEAADLAARTLAAIEQHYAVWLDKASPWLAADRERIASDLAGLREAHDWMRVDGQRNQAHANLVRYADGLRRTGALYGVGDL